MLQFKLAKRCHSSFLHPSKFSTSSSLEFVSPDLLKLITKCFCFFPLCSSWLPSTLQPKRSFFFHSNAKKEGKENKNPKIRKTSVYLMFFKILCLIWNQGSNNKSSSCFSFQWGLRDFSSSCTNSKFVTHITVIPRMHLWNANALKCFI